VKNLPVSMIQCQPVIVVLRYALFSPRVDRGLEQAFVSFSFLNDHFFQCPVKFKFKLFIDLTT